MKKFFAIIVVLCLVSCFSSCKQKNEISSITIGEDTCFPLYLCSFDNADVNYDYTPIHKTDLKPTSNGYVLVTDKQSSKATVWEQFVFTRKLEATSYSSADCQTLADITQIVEQYPIQVDIQRDTYIITYYTFSYKTDSDPERLKESINKHIIEIAKENVVISYYK